MNFELSDEQKEKFTNQVTKEIERLKETREPVVKTSRFRGEFYATYSAERARTIRKSRK